MKIISTFFLCVVIFTAVLTVEAQNQTNSKQTDNQSTKNSGSFQKAVFAGGCFWCMEKPFEELDGVISVVSGYTDGTTTNPTYATYIKGGHIEVVQILYDPKLINYEKLLDVYWRQINPTDPGGQFVDRGHAYTTAIFYFNKKQHALAGASKKDMNQKGVFSKPIVTPIIPAATFYPAEDYHQD